MSNFVNTKNPTPFGFEKLLENANFSKPDNRQGVYVIYSKKNNKFYIGSSVSILKRKSQHFHHLKNGHHQNAYLQSSFNKNKNHFVFGVLFYTEDSLAWEQKLLDIYYDNQKQCYNLSKTASFPSISKEGKKRLSDSKKKMHAENPWIREKACAARKTPEVKRIQRETNLKQRKDPNYAIYLANCCREKLKKYYNVTLINKEGRTLFIGWNLREFCRKNNFDRANINRLLGNKAKSVMGWRLYE
jgi:group I intron endonuclease